MRNHHIVHRPFLPALPIFYCACVHHISRSRGGWGAVQCGGTVVVVGMIVMIGDNLGNLSP